MLCLESQWGTKSVKSGIRAMEIDPWVSTRDGGGYRVNSNDQRRHQGEEEEEENIQISCEG